MTNSELYQLRYPIGTFTKPNTITKTQRETWISTIEDFPKSLKTLVHTLDEKALNYNYRPEGWTIKQVVHHCADSHMNSIIRFKLAITEDTPTIRPYYEDRWAELVDYNSDINHALAILDGVHAKLGLLMRHFSKEDLQREFVHPEHGKRFSVEETIGVYAWHSNHHFAHIQQALQYKGKF